jgi:hypothetical protein
MEIQSLSVTFYIMTRFLDYSVQKGQRTFNFLKFPILTNSVKKNKHQEQNLTLVCNFLNTTEKRQSPVLTKICENFSF